MNAHTPGPWVAEEEVRAIGGITSIYVSKVDPSMPNGLDGRVCQAFGNCLVTTDDAVRANARLLAAAPELIAALRECADTLQKLVDMDRLPANSKDLRDARAAISKATGIA